MPDDDYMKSLTAQNNNDRSDNSSWIVGGSISIIAISILVLHAFYYLPFISDDALISLRYSQRLLEGHGLTWTDGQPVEGYSNFLWVLACSFLGLLGFDLILASRILGIGGMAAAVLAVLYAYRPGNLSEALPALGGVLALALAGPIAIWAIGGLEQAFIAGLLAWTIVLCYPLLKSGSGKKYEAFAPGLLAGLLILSRPDSPLLVTAIVLGLLFARGIDKKTMLTGMYLIALPIVFFLAQEIFRLYYYGDWIPNTARVKLSFTTSRLETGWDYLLRGGWSFFALLIPACAAFSGLKNNRFARNRLVLLVLPLVVWNVYVVIIGGDIFPGHRLLVPGIVLLALLVAEALSRAARHGKLLRLSSWVIMGGMLIWFFSVQMTDPQNARALNERWEWDGEVVGKLLRQAFGDHGPLLAVDPSGCLPYFSGLPSLDMLGLCDRTIAKTPPADFGHGWIGHELGNGKYVLDRKPDLVVFNGPMGHWNPRVPPEFRSAREMMKDKRFQKFYQLVTFEGTDPHQYFSRIWVRKEDGKLGIERRRARIEVPGYLISSNLKSVARLDDSGRIGITATKADPARITGLSVPEGTWQLSVNTSVKNVDVVVRDTHKNKDKDKVYNMIESGMLLEIDAGDPASIDVEITPVEDVSMHVRSMSLEKIKIVE